MSNCKASSSIGHSIVNLSDREAIIESFRSVLEQDCDLHENGEEYWQEDTVELGYENEMERILDKATKDIEEFDIVMYEAMFNKVLNAMDDYWGNCEVSVLDLGNGSVAVAYMVGGSNDY